MSSSMFIPQKRILIVGAGIAGLSLARQLKKFKIPFLIIEKRSHLSSEGAGIPLPANAVKAVKHIGLGLELEQHSHQVNKVIYTDPTGEILNESSLLESPLNVDRFVALHRGKFHEILKDQLDQYISLGVTIDCMKEMDDGVYVRFQDAKLKSELFSLVVGADGIHSQIRQLIFPEQSLIDFGITTWRWICNYPTEHLQPTYMFGSCETFMAYPIGKNEVYCYAHCFDPDYAVYKRADYHSSLKVIFEKHGGVAKIMLDFLPKNELIITSRLKSVPQPLYGSGRVALIGDASHACSPMLQQGAATAIEDGIILSNLIKLFSISDALIHFKNFRQNRMDWITSSSDGSMKKVINISADELSKLYKNIRESGPLNVQGWKKLHATDVFAEFREYVHAALAVNNSGHSNKAKL